MRTAVCLSGQARYISKNFENIINSLIVPTAADVFCYFWDTAGGHLEPHKALDVFKPVSYSLEPQRVFDTDSLQFILPDNQIPLARYQNIHSQYYSIQQVHLLKRQYEKEHGFVYDCVMRARTDITFDREFDPSEFNSNPLALWLHNLDKSPVGTSCADLFAFSNSSQMDIYSNCFSHLPRLVKEGRHCFAETLLYDYIRPLSDISLTRMGYKIMRK